MTNKEIVERFYEKVFNQWDMSDLDQVMREDYIQHSPEVAEGREGFKEFFRHFLAACRSIPVEKSVAISRRHLWAI